MSNDLKNLKNLALGLDEDDAESLREFQKGKNNFNLKAP